MRQGATGCDRVREGFSYDVRDIRHKYIVNCNCKILDKLGRICVEW